MPVDPTHVHNRLPGTPGWLRAGIVCFLAVVSLLFAIDDFQQHRWPIWFSEAGIAVVLFLWVVMAVIVVRKGSRQQGTARGSSS